MKYFFSLILFVLFINFSFAQDSSNTKRNEFKHGIQFQIRSLLELTNYNGYTFSYRYCINEKSGLRVSFLLAVDETDYETTQQLDSISINPTEIYDAKNFKVSVQYLHNILDYKDFSLILGAGPFISYSNYESSDEYLSSNYISKYFDKNKRTGYGLDLLLGVEYNPFENVVLSGEYGLSFSNEKSDFESFQKNVYHDGSPERIYKEAGVYDRFVIKGLGVNLGIAVFF